MNYIMTIILLLAIAAILLLLANVFKDYRKSRQQHGLLRYFNRLGRRYHLQFSRVEVFPSTIIGLDEEQGMLLEVKRKKANSASSRLINLADLQNCVLEKKYSLQPLIRNNGERRVRLLEKIVLHITLKKGAPVHLVFYNHLVNPVMDLTRLAGKAAHWETSLSRLIEPQRQIA